MMPGAGHGAWCFLPKLSPGGKLPGFLSSELIAKIDALAPSDRFTAQGKAMIDEIIRIKGWVMSLAPADCWPIVDAVDRYMERCKAARLQVPPCVMRHVVP